jgi:hypothetical protein
MLEDDTRKERISLLRKRLREPEMKEVFENRFKSIIELYKANVEKKQNLNLKIANNIPW